MVTVKPHAALGVALVTLGLISPVAATPQPELLPAILPGDGPATAPKRAWTIADAVEVSRITSIAAQPSGGEVAFVVRLPSIALARDRYALYVADGRRGGARKLIEAAYLDGVQARPGRLPRWTVRADLGRGTQLYEIGPSGQATPLVRNPTVVPVGGYDGAIVASSQGRYPTGVAGYQWSPDGRALWYSAFRPRSPAEQRNDVESGVVYDDLRHYPSDFFTPPSASAMELHIFEPATRSDRIVAVLPGDRSDLLWASFTRSHTHWIDAYRITFRRNRYDSAGARDIERLVVDTRSGETTKVSGKAQGDAYATALPGGSLLLERSGTGSKLVQRADDGSVQRDFGLVSFEAISFGNEIVASSPGRGTVLSVRYADRLGLALLGDEIAQPAFAKLPDTLDDCTADADATVAWCSRESIDRAPELVAVSLITGDVTVLARPNARYDAIKKLVSERREWTNRFGSRNGGYVTYPEDYRAGTAYPTAVITHGRDARNRFVYGGLQWDFPVQVLAARGWLVLSVNEPRPNPEAAAAYQRQGGAPSTSLMQFEYGFNPIASMEAAVQAEIDAGRADPARVGIAGFSRGGELTQLVMTQSKMFRAAIAADDTWYNPAGYWISGVRGKGTYRSLFGGPITDPAAFEAYRNFSPAARAGKFAGPLLQQSSDLLAPYAQELHVALREAGVPTELVYYRDETHILHHPRRRAAAMQISFDWFEFWLRGREDVDPARKAQFERWRSMRAAQSN